MNRTALRSGSAPRLDQDPVVSVRQRSGPAADGAACLLEGLRAVPRRGRAGLGVQEAVHVVGGRVFEPDRVANRGGDRRIPARQSIFTAAVAHIRQQYCVCVLLCVAVCVCVCVRAMRVRGAVRPPLSVCLHACVVPLSTDVITPWCATVHSARPSSSVTTCIAESLGECSQWLPGSMVPRHDRVTLFIISIVHTMIVRDNTTGSAAALVRRTKTRQHRHRPHLPV